MVLSSLHVVLVFTCFFIPKHWYALGWTYPVLNAVLLVLNLMYAFFWNKDVPKISDDILDA
jgi:hypothetical protein